MTCQKCTWMQLRFKWFLRLVDCLEQIPSPWGFSEILGFWTLSIVLALKKRTKEKHDVSETLSKGPNRIGFPSPEDGNKSSFRNVVFFLSLFFNTRTMDKVRKPSISESYTPSSESYSNSLRVFYPQIEKPYLNRYQEHYCILNTTLILVCCLLFTQRKIPILRYSAHLTGV
jgi:hypothetical protein